MCEGLKGGRKEGGRREEQGRGWEGGKEGVDNAQCRQWCLQ